jgi:serine/threonine-protein kinase
MELGRHSIVEWAESAPDGDADFAPAQEKFLVEMSIGKGGMGEVFLVTDQDLKRQVAMKVLRRDAKIGRDQRLHFIAEAQATSQLEHPGIPPVHDIGLTEAGQLYFTMKLVQGRTLREVLHDLALKRREVHREYTLHKLISILERVCEPLHFSHEKGVIHRDIKPENIMLGDYGEVHVMDWGLARIEEASADLAEIGAVETARRDAGLETKEGAVKGTLPYMSPEQLRGEQLDGRSDVYAVGCLLYEILTLHPAFDPGDEELLLKILSGNFPDVRTRNPRRAVPVPLAAICQKALATHKGDRYASADELAVALRRWLDGRAERERRHEEAERLAAEGKVAAGRYMALKADVIRAEAAAEAEAGNFKPFQPVAEKRPLIEARRAVETFETQAALAFGETTHLLGAALTQEADNATARRAVADLWKTRLEDAERRRDAAGTAYALAVIKQHSDAALPNTGTLTLASEPAGADVFISRFEETDGVLTPRSERPLGQTPLDPVELPMGSYLCVLRKEGFRDARYPVHITRERAWKGQVHLRTDDEIGDGFVYVPAGPFTYGEGKDAETRELPDFAIAKYPVTFGEYGEFLDALDDEEAARRLPRSPGDGPYMERSPDGRHRPLVTIEGAALERCLREHGEDFSLRIPVGGVDCDDAAAYCAWKTKTTGRDWRLPTEEEREKAARGVDGRDYPWGDLADPSLGKCRNSRDEPPQPEPVGGFPSAVSVYGMGDAAGNKWDWTDSWSDEGRSSRVLRGGAWSNTISLLRCSSRLTNEPGYRYGSFGFRCARSF